jgi:hypothetical protein
MRTRATARRSWATATPLAGEPVARTLAAVLVLGALAFGVGFAVSRAGGDDDAPAAEPAGTTVKLAAVKDEGTAPEISGLGRAAELPGLRRPPRPESTPAPSAGPSPTVVPTASPSAPAPVTPQPPAGGGGGGGGGGGSTGGGGG